MNETPVRKPSGNVIWKNLISIYPGAVLYGLLFNVSLMICNMNIKMGRIS